MMALLIWSCASDAAGKAMVIAGSQARVAGILRRRGVVRGGTKRAVSQASRVRSQSWDGRATSKAPGAIRAQPLASGSRRGFSILWRTGVWSYRTASWTVVRSCQDHAYCSCQERGSPDFGHVPAAYKRKPPPPQYSSLHHCSTHIHLGMQTYVTKEVGQLDQIVGQRACCAFCTGSGVRARGHRD